MIHALPLAITLLVGGVAHAQDSPAAPPSATAADDAAGTAAVAGEAVGVVPLDQGAVPAPSAAPRVAAPVHRTSTERWLRGQVPDELERPGPFDIEWWQWLALPLIGLMSAALGRVVGGGARAALRRLAVATPSPLDDELLERSRGPLYLACAVGAAWVLTGFAYLNAAASARLDQALSIGLLVAILQIASRGAEAAGANASQKAVAAGNPAAASVVPLVVRASKIGLFALGVVTALSTLGYPVTSLLAGLGIGGLALALAAQKTAENVFGSVSIGVDQPLRVGDFVKIEDFMGTVDRIGLRSTSIRTLDRTIVTLPNGRLADMRIENYTMRDRMRLFVTIGLEYGTTPEQIRAVLAGVDARLRAHPDIWPEDTVVHFARLGASSLDIDVSAWFLITDARQLHRIREEMLFAFLEVVSEVGAGVAFPTQTLHIAKASTPGEDPDERDDT